LSEEIEAKVRIADPEVFRARMNARGAPVAETVQEVNRLFDDAAGSLRQGGSALRLREDRRPADGAVLRTLLTFKGPRRQSRMKRRLEFETAVGSAEPMAAILGAIGLAEVFYYEKHRTAWRLADCEVVLDELPHLGWFVEVEGPSEESVLARLADLGLAGEPIIREAYLTLLSEHAVRSGGSPTHFGFEA
jgi:adenylate cyclase class 2